MYESAFVGDKKIFILGAGGHAKVVVDVLLAQNIKISALVAPVCDTQSAILGGLSLISDEVLRGFDVDDALLFNGIGSLPGSSMRWRLFEEYTSLGFGFGNVISQNALVSNSAVLGSGVQALHGVIVQCEAKIGSNTLINTRAVIEHDCKIGSHCHIAPSATLSGGVIIGDRVHIGTGAIVIQGIKVGSNSVIGAGAIVTKDLPDHTVFFPARGTLKSRD